jgi:O-acetyl-ADP-ribose deacetylase (regulator of RNase III)
MTQEERLRYLIEALLAEDDRYCGVAVPEGEEEQWRLLRSLMNVRPARPIGADFLGVQDLWRGDITTLRVDAIVNAANSRMEGCWEPCHDCIDNCIHTWAGVQLRLRCHEIMERQGHPEPTGRAEITPGYNLPAKYVLHTVGPIIHARVSERDRELLASCYARGLELAAENGCRAVAFCAISTGVFRFPQEEAADIAVRTVRETLDRGCGVARVVFDVFTAGDEAIYRRLLG